VSFVAAQQFGSDWRNSGGGWSALETVLLTRSGNCAGFAKIEKQLIHVSALMSRITVSLDLRLIVQNGIQQ
jgi:hypothetical protein